MIIFLALLVTFDVIFNYFSLRFLDASASTIDLVDIVVGACCFAYLLFAEKLLKVEVFGALFFLIIAFSFGPFLQSESSFIFSFGGPFSGLLIVSYYFMAKIINYARWERFFSLFLYIAFLVSYIWYAFSVKDVFAIGFFNDKSYNFISIVLIFLSAAVVLSWEDRFWIPFLVLLSTLFISLLLYTRASVAISTALFTWFLLWRLKDLKVLIFACFLIGLLFIGFIYMPDVYESTKFSSNGLDSPRWNMWQNYFIAQNWESFLFGVDLTTIELIKDFNGNPHNTFIRLHSVLGFFGIAFLFSYLSFALIKLPFFASGILALMLLRATTDIFLFPGVLDIVFHLAFLTSLNHNRPQKRFNLGFIE